MDSEKILISWLDFGNAILKAIFVCDQPPFKIIETSFPLDNDHLEVTVCLLSKKPNQDFKCKFLPEASAVEFDRQFVKAALSREICRQRQIFPVAEVVSELPPGLPEKIRIKLGPMSFDEKGMVIYEPGWPLAGKVIDSPVVRRRKFHSAAEYIEGGQVTSFQKASELAGDDVALAMVIMHFRAGIRRVMSNRPDSQIDPVELKNRVDDILKKRFSV